MARDKNTYIEKYRSPYLKIKKDCNPIMRHTVIGTEVVSAEIRAMGTVERNGEELEFHDIRVFYRVPA